MRKMMNFQASGVVLLWLYSPSGDRIIDLCAIEMGQTCLESRGRCDWLVSHNRPRLLETQSVEAGIGETSKICSVVKKISLNDISFSYAAADGWSPWWSDMDRRSLALHRQRDSADSFEKPRIMKSCQWSWSGYRKKHPNAVLLEFYRDHSLDLLGRKRDSSRTRKSPKNYSPPKGHAILCPPLIQLKGDSDRLKSSGRNRWIYFVNEEKSGKFKGSLHYIWLLPGAFSGTWTPKDQMSSEGLMNDHSLDRGPECRLSNLVIYIWTRGNWHICMSRERLEAGKQLLIRSWASKIHILKIIWRNSSKKTWRWDGWWRWISSTEDDYDEKGGDGWWIWDCRTRLIGAHDSALARYTQPEGVHLAVCSDTEGREELRSIEGLEY